MTLTGLLWAERASDRQQSLFVLIIRASLVYTNLIKLGHQT